MRSKISARPRDQSAPVKVLQDRRPNEIGSNAVGMWIVEVSYGNAQSTTSKVRAPDPTQAAHLALSTVQADLRDHLTEAENQEVPLRFANVFHANHDWSAMAPVGCFELQNDRAGATFARRVRYLELVQSGTAS
jgi:hypothetical protein